MAEEQNTQNQQAEQPEQEQQKNSAVDYSKIEAMVARGMQQKESAILKSYFEQQGMTEDEIKAAVSEYKANKAKSANEQKTSFENMQKENEQLRAQVMQNNINAKAMDIGLDMGVDKNAVAYLVKMADLSKVVNENGEVSEEAIKNAFDQVLKDVPALKVSVNSNDGFKVGADSYKQDNDKENLLRKAAGLPPKK